MLRHIILPLAAVFCGASCCLNAAENDTLEKMFSNISIFRKGDVQKKNDRANTKSVRYLGPQQLFFTVSVLNPAGKDITEGAASAELKQAFAQAVETQKQLRKGLKEEKTETLSLRCLAGKKLTGIYTVLTYTDNNLPYHICIFMTGYRGNLLKVEFAPAVPLKLEPQDRLFRALLEQAKANFYTGEKTNVPQNIKDTIARAVRALEENPLEAGSVAAQAVRKFTDDSPDVFVMIQENDMPWLPKLRSGTPAEKKYLNLLLASFMGGNVRAQLEQNICQDMRNAGLASMKKTYAKIREADPSFQLRELEQESKR